MYNQQTVCEKPAEKSAGQSLASQQELLEGLPHVLTLEQAAQVLQIGVTTARSFCREHKLPAIKVGRSWRIPKAHLKDFLNGAGLDRGGE